MMRALLLSMRLEQVRPPPPGWGTAVRDMHGLAVPTCLRVVCAHAGLVCATPEPTHHHGLLLHALETVRQESHRFDARTNVLLRCTMAQ